MKVMQKRINRSSYPLMSLLSSNSDEARAGDLEMQAANQSVVTQDGELMAVNGKLLSANYGAGGMMAAPKAASVVSVTTVCSCTCYPRSKHFSSDTRNR